jgi:acetylornithine deacetylase/succinyl-diaminopimelate desuccinylase-like protein
MVKEFFLKMAPKQPSDERKFFEDIEKGLLDPSFSAKLTSSLIYNAMLRDTISLTILQAGSKSNVIPSEATATLDCRLLPGSSKENFLKEIKKRLGDEIEVEGKMEGNSYPPLPWTRIFFRLSKNLLPRLIRIAQSFLSSSPEPRTAVS